MVISGEGDTWSIPDNPHLKDEQGERYQICRKVILSMSLKPNGPTLVQPNSGEPLHLMSADF